jgi:hypothetical protein
MVARSATENVNYRYALDIDSDLTDPKQVPAGPKMRAQIQFVYSVRWRAQTADLIAHSMKGKMFHGADERSMEFDKSKLILKDARGNLDESYEKAEPQVKAMLDQCFETVLCQIEYDEDGRELRRVKTAGPSAGALLNHGFIANVCLSRAPVPKQKKSWDAPAEIPTDDINVAKGILFYDATESPKDAEKDVLCVKVSGHLDGARKGNDGTLESLHYTLDGFEVYDRRLRDWIAGNLKIDLSKKVGDDQRPSGKISVRSRILGN